MVVGRGKLKEQAQPRRGSKARRAGSFRRVLRLNVDDADDGCMLPSEILLRSRIPE